MDTLFRKYLEVSKEFKRYKCVVPTCCVCHSLFVSEFWLAYMHTFKRYQCQSSDWLTRIPLKLMTETSWDVHYNSQLGYFNYMVLVFWGNTSHISSSFITHKYNIAMNSHALHGVGLYTNPLHSYYWSNELWIGIHRNSKGTGKDKDQ